MNQAAFTQPCITLLYGDHKMHFPEELQLALDYASVEGSPHPENIQVDVQLLEADRMAAEMIFLEHKIKILGASLQLPKEVMRRCLQSSHWQRDFKKTLAGHQSQIVLSYSGPGKNPLEKMMMLYKVAYGLRHESLLGVVNEPAWTAHPILDTLKPARIRSYRDSIPFLLWFGYLKIPLTQELFWLVTKGHGVFNLPDLAFLMAQGEDLSAVMNTFFNVFYTMMGINGNVHVGDTLEVSASGEYLRFTELPDLPGFEEWRISPKSTLLLERIDPSERAGETM
jgi:hypothetical protein